MRGCFLLKILLIFVDIFSWKAGQPITVCNRLGQSGLRHTRYGGCVAEHTKIIVYYYIFLEFGAEIL
jgi:hypothetical protein